MMLLDTGVSISTVSSQFEIGKTTLYEWQRRRKATGDFQSKKLGSVGYGHKIIDWDAFQAFAEENGSKTQVEMAQLWSVPLSPTTIHRGLKHIGFTRKKRPTAIKSEMTMKEHLL